MILDYIIVILIYCLFYYIYSINTINNFKNIKILDKHMKYKHRNKHKFF